MQRFTNKDMQHLELLTIFYYIFGGISILFSFFPLLYVIIGILYIMSPELVAGKELDTSVTPFLGWLFIALGSVFILLGLAYAICLINTGRFLARRKHYLFCLIMGCLSCISFPFGTILGVFTIIVINRQSVKEQFRQIKS